MRPSLSIIIPVYRSEQTLPALLQRLGETLPALADRFEVVLVNDGSPDQSWQVVQELAARYAWARGLSLMRNYGQHNALLCGVRDARHEIIVTIDDDLQNPPEEIATLLAKLDEGYDAVYGTPRRERHGFFRDLASQITKWASQAGMGAETARNVSAFRVFRAQLREAFASYQSPYVNLDVLLTWGTSRFAAVTVRHEARQVGVSNYNVRKLMVHALNMMTGFSTAPLRLASLIGFGFTLFGMVILAYVLIRYLLQGSPVPGFPFLASMIAIFSGAQMFALGIMGEYLARIHMRMMDRPTYTIRETTIRETTCDKEKAL